MIQCNRLPHFVYSISSEPNACNIIGDYRSFNCLRRFYLLRNAKKMYIENFDRISIQLCLTKFLIKFVFSVLNGFSRYHLTDCSLFGFHSTEFVCTNFVFDENGFMFESIFHDPWAVDYIVIISTHWDEAWNIRWYALVLNFWFNSNRLLFRQIFGSLNDMNSLNLQIETVLQIYF